MSKNLYSFTDHEGSQSYNINFKKIQILELISNQLGPDIF